LSRTRFAAAYTVARSLYGKMIKASGLRDIAGARSVKAALAVLSQTHYGSIMEKIPARRRVVRLVEHALKQSLIEDGVKLGRFLDDASRQFIGLVLSRYEMANIKSVMRALHNNEDLDRVRELLFDLKTYASVSIRQLLQSRSIGDLVDALKTSPYGDVLEASYQRFRREDSITPIEVGLDLHYFTSLWEGMGTLRRTDREGVIQVKGTEMDVRNIEWVLRFKLNLGLGPEEIFHYTVPFGCRIDDEILWRMVNAQNPEEFIEAVPAPYDRFVRSARRDRDIDQVMLEILLWRHIFEVASNVFHKQPVNLGMVVAYLTLKRIEIDDIISILESKRYGMNADEVGEYLIRRP